MVAMKTQHQWRDRQYRQELGCLGELYTAGGVAMWWCKSSEVCTLTYQGYDSHYTLYGCSQAFCYLVKQIKIAYNTPVQLYQLQYYSPWTNLWFRCKTSKSQSLVAKQHEMSYVSPLCCNMIHVAYRMQSLHGHATENALVLNYFSLDQYDISVTLNIDSVTEITRALIEWAISARCVDTTIACWSMNE